MNHNPSPQIEIHGKQIQTRRSPLHGGFFFPNLNCEINCTTCGSKVQMHMNAYYLDKFQFDKPNRMYFVCIRSHDTEAWLTISSDLKKVSLEVRP